MAAYDIVRLCVLALASAGTVIALGSWAVTTRRINPLSRPARAIRRLSDPILLPLERWMVRRGQNPQNAPWWLLGLVIAGSIAVLTAAGWLLETAARLVAAGQSGPRSLIRLLIYLAAQLILFSLIVRVVASWFGGGRSSRWLRPAYRLTDWIVEPLRRFIPPIGIIDITPLVAWFLLQIVLTVIMRAI